MSPDTSWSERRSCMTEGDCAITTQVRLGPRVWDASVPGVPECEADAARAAARAPARAAVESYALDALTCLLASACASTPKSYMLVPSRTTVPEVEKLSRQSGTTVDVLTVNREERRFLLDRWGRCRSDGA